MKRDQNITDDLHMCINCKNETVNQRKEMYAYQIKPSMSKRPW